jgi:Flp pilus assembly protein TadB
MNSLAVVNAVLGAGAGLGLLVSVWGWRSKPAGGMRRHFLRRHGGARAGERLTARLALAGGAGVVAGLATGWPVAALLVAAAVWAAPAVFGHDRDATGRLERIEAVAGWAEQLRDTLAAAAGLEQAIIATAGTAPAPIRAEVRVLASRLEYGQPLAAGLRELATELADSTADLVVAALLLAAEHQARQLAELLGSLADAARDQARMRLRIGAGRARTRTSMRVVVITTVTLACGLVVLNHGYLAPYGHSAGQIVLLAVGGLFAFGFWWLQRLARIAEPDRVLSRLGEPGGLGALGTGGWVGR